MTEAMSKEEPVKGVNMLAVVLLILGGLVAMALGGTLIPGVKEGLNNWFGNNPGTEESLNVTENFNKTIDNINNCSAINDEECICDVWPDFSVVFPKDYSLLFKGFAGNVQLIKNDKKILEGTIEPDIGAYPFALNNGNLFYKNYYYLLGDYINFNKEYPEIEKKSNNVVISKYFIKNDLGDLFVITYYGKNPSKEKITEINTEIEKFPKCAEGRRDAIDEFNRIKNSIASATGEYTVQLPDGFSISIKNQEISLLYNEDQTADMDYEKSTTDAETYNIQLKEMKAPIQLCSDSRKEGSLKNNDVINIKQENTGSGTINCLSF